MPAPHGADTLWVHGCRLITLGALAGVLATAGLAAPNAFAANRYVTPAGAASGTCTLAPCSLDYAVQNAVDGDVVLLAAGTYPVTGTVSSASAIQIRPEVAGTRPRLADADTLAAPTLSLTAGGVVEGLQVESSDNTALQLAGGSRGDRLVLLADGAGARAATLASDPARTALVNTVAQTTNATGVIDVTDGASPGHVSMVNLTAVAKAPGAYGVRTSTITESAVLKNSIVRSATMQLYTTPATPVDRRLDLELLGRELAAVHRRGRQPARRRADVRRRGRRRLPPGRVLPDHGRRRRRSADRRHDRPRRPRPHARLRTGHRRVRGRAGARPRVRWRRSRPR